MSAGTLSPQGPTVPRVTVIHLLGSGVIRLVEGAGGLMLLLAGIAGRVLTGLPPRRVLLTQMYEIGVLSLPVVAITGGFIGMVLAVQTYDTLRTMGFENRIGSVINVSLVKELGPVLAATMLAGRVGSRMAAELGTMRVTEQIDALRALGADPVRYLAVPRFLSCFLLIPLLTVVADLIGMLGGWFFSTEVLGINSVEYWRHTLAFITGYDALTGLFKSLWFGAAIAVVACDRGFRCGAGAEGVGRAATESFVYSFVVILMIDFVLGAFLSSFYYVLWPGPVSL